MIFRKGVDCDRLTYKSISVLTFYVATANTSPLMQRAFDRFRVILAYDHILFLSLRSVLRSGCILIACTTGRRISCTSKDAHLSRTPDLFNIESLGDRITGGSPTATRIVTRIFNIAGLLLSKACITSMYCIIL